MTTAADLNEVLQRQGVDEVRSRYDGAVALNGQDKGRSCGDREQQHDKSQDDEAERSTEEVKTEIARLAKLSPTEYELVRKKVAKRLDFRPSALDGAIKAVRGDAEERTGQGRPLSLVDPEPCEDLVDGQELFDAIVATVHRFVVLPDNQAIVVALWVLHTYLFDVFVVTPRLAIASPEKGCGKTTLLDLVSHLVPRALPACNITSAIYRVVEAARPTLLIDEADNLRLSENDELRGIFNAGHRKGSDAIRCVGDNFEPRQFATYGPLAIALIGTLPDTVANRSIHVRMRRRRAEERIASLRIGRDEQFSRLASMVARWAIDNRDRVQHSNPDMGELVNRMADNWYPLFAIAETIGLDCLARAKAASVALSGDDDEGDSMGTMMLSDIRTFFENNRGSDRASSEALVDYLNGLEDRPWQEFKSGKPLTKNQLARQLRRFGIKSAGTIRLSNNDTAKGYWRKDFEDAFARYLPSEKASQTVTASHA